jgi:uncharacterized iron-regulated membrane protein
MEKILDTTALKRIRLNTLHRYVGIVLAPFLVIQTLSGLLLDFGPFRRGGSFLGGEQSPVWSGALSRLMVNIHFGPGLLSDAYHLLLGTAIFWMAVTGWMLYLRIRRARRNLATNNRGNGQTRGGGI